MKEKRAIRLINYKTGQTRSASSIVNFAKNHGSNPNDKYHFSAVLNGYRYAFKGWMTLEVYDLLAQKCDWIDIYGNQYKMSVLEVMDAIGLQNISCSISRILEGTAYNIGGLYLGDELPNKIIQPRKIRIKSYCFMKNGKYYKGTAISSLSKQLKISKNSLYDLIYGRRVRSKNIVLHSASIVEKNIFEEVSNYRKQEN